jgi:hypothetical protein
MLEICFQKISEFGAKIRKPYKILALDQEFMAIIGARSNEQARR